MVRLVWSIEVLTTTFLVGNCVCFLLSIIPSVAAFAETLRVRRVVPSVSPQDAYARCLRGWKRDNLGLVGVPPPILLRDGHPDTGVGMLLLRIPPFGLKEGIVGCQRDECSTTMNYQVLNPGWFTWPVAEHEGWIRFASDGEQGCILEWTVQWTPLPLPLSFWNGFLKALTTVIVETAASYVARGGSGAYQSVAIRKKE